MSPTITAAVIAASVSFLTLIGTLAAQYFGRRATSRDTQGALEEQRKQLDRTLAEQRTRTLNERFATAAGQLGSDKPPEVRLAGVYAMAGLADDWPENRQTCVDVLCGYLRLPYHPDPGDGADPDVQSAYRRNREVRHTVIRVIAAHLKDDSVTSWQGLNFDFTGVVFDGGDFSGAEFSGGMVLFDRAEFSGGEVLFNHATFSGGTVRFNVAEFSGGVVRFNDAEFSGGVVLFDEAQFSAGGMVLFKSVRFCGSEISFSDAGFSGGTVVFDEAEFSDSPVYIGAWFDDGRVDFDRARFCGADVLFDARFSGGMVRFNRATFSSGLVRFDGARFCGSEISFDEAEFSDGTVDFRDARDWSFPPAFPWTGTPPSGVKLPEKEDQSRA
jgi:uncharacterized protein YjbI with pentapeptide repeats